KSRLLEIGDKFEKDIAADRHEDAKFR
ncbi:uncharacterized protein METZ01_LOCUS346727, partial [marine metagenome]